jgi:hypothetical protein
MLEAGEIDDLSIGEVDRCFASLGARLDLSAWWRGAALDRLLDEGHARLVGEVLRRLQSLGWEVRVEVSFSSFGERGSIDILAWHPAHRVLAVFEIKSELGGMDPLLRPLDVKARLAPQIAAREFGWRASGPVGRIVVLPEDRTVRRQVSRHADVLAAALPARSREIPRWLAKPSTPMAGIWFLTEVGRADTMRNPSATRRVRRPSPRSTGAPGRGRRSRESAIDPRKVGPADK